eukprot:1793503-Prymnesium_polylepis.1
MRRRQDRRDRQCTPWVEHTAVGLELACQPCVSAASVHVLPPDPKTISERQTGEELKGMLRF